MEAKKSHDASTCAIPLPSNAYFDMFQKRQLHYLQACILYLDSPSLLKLCWVWQTSLRFSSRVCQVARSSLPSLPCSKRAPFPGDQAFSWGQVAGTVFMVETRVERGSGADRWYCGLMYLGSTRCCVCICCYRGLGECISSLIEHQYAHTRSTPVSHVPRSKTCLSLLH